MGLRQTHKFSSVFIVYTGASWFE